MVDGAENNVTWVSNFVWIKANSGCIRFAQGIVLNGNNKCRYPGGLR